MRIMSENGQSPIVRFGFGVGAFFCLIGGPICGFFLGRMFLEARASEKWPTVIGKLTRVQVAETEVGRYYADVSYEYRVDDRGFTGSRVRASDGEYDFRDGAVQAIRGLTVGNQIPVHYNPADPQQSVLHAGAGFQEYALLLVPIGMLVFGLWAFRQLWRTRSDYDRSHTN
jgi:hypothetical protein